MSGNRFHPAHRVVTKLSRKVVTRSHENATHRESWLGTEPYRASVVVRVEAPKGENRIQQEKIMLGWALTFLIVALIAAALGFGGIAGASAGIAKILFIVFIILFVVAMIARALRGRPPV